MKRSNHKPRFFWQGVLILTPMLVLAKVGALAIWQDKRMAEHEAQLRAQDLAEQAAALLSTAWSQTPPTSSGNILLDFNGNLISPQPISSELPIPPVISDQQSELLHRARAAEFGGDSAQAIDLFQKLLGANPSPELAQQVRYVLGLLFISAKDTTNAALSFQRLLDDSSAAVGDGGSDLRILSQLRLAQLAGSGHEVVCSNAVSTPTLLTTEILRVVFDEAAAGAAEAAEKWWRVWLHHEWLRHIHALLRPSFRTNFTAPVTNLFRSIVSRPVEPPEWSWVQVTNNGQFSRELINLDGFAASRGLFIPEDGSSILLVEGRVRGTNHLLGVRTSSALNKWASDRLKALRLPEYFGVSVALSDQDVIRPQDLPAVIASGGGGKGSGRIWTKTNRTNAPPALATAAQMSANNLTLLARVHLIGPDLLFEQQNARSLWFRMVIVIAALTSVVGFISAYRAFKKQLRLADLKSNFVSSVSHELRAPIASVRLMAEGLERGRITEPEKQREYFRFITQECRRLSSMIENVLDFARIDQGRKQYEFEPTDLVALVEKTMMLMEPYAAERGVRLAVSVPQVSGRLVEGDGWDMRQIGEGKTAAMIDGQAVQQALVNLIDNAIKHSRSGSEVLVTLSFDPRLSTFSLCVADHGPGIPAAEHEKIFERFYRLGSELRRETSGVGIGLSIVKHVVEAHDGQVRVESEPGKGSRFTIELPLTPRTQKWREDS